jgi:DNA invertase Pin-like site-specific DNA recombinase
MPQPNVIGYVRVSTTEQASEGFGLEVQEKAIRAYCRSNKLRLVAVFGDEGISGSNGLDARRGLAEALARIEAGEASALVVHKLDRLARDLILQETTIQSLKATGATVLSVSEPDTDSDDPTRVLMRQMMGAFSQYERTLIRGRMMAGKAQKVAQGGYGGGRPAYGRMASNRQLVANVGEAELVGTVIALRKAGESYRTIATALAEKGMTTRSGGMFNPNQIRRIAQRQGVA